MVTGTETNPSNMYNIPGRIPLPSALPIVPTFPSGPPLGILKKPPPVLVDPVCAVVNKTNSFHYY